LPRSVDPGVELLVDLFRFVLDRVRRRASVTHCERLAEQLAEMYLCETGQAGNALHAKVLPIAFFGELVDDPSGRARKLLYKLGVFLALIDDWQDLASDIVGRTANRFVNGGESFGAHRYVSAALGRILGGGLSHRQISLALSVALRDVLDCASAADRPTEKKTVALARGLLGMRRAS
jgi:hypothetical protein